jgi:hypothetical protein
MYNRHDKTGVELLHVRFGLTGTRTVNTTPNIQTRGLHMRGKGPPPTVERRDWTSPIKQRYPTL